VRVECPTVQMAGGIVPQANRAHPRSLVVAGYSPPCIKSRTGANHADHESGHDAGMRPSPPSCITAHRRAHDHQEFTHASDTNRADFGYLYSLHNVRLVIHLREGAQSGPIRIWLYPVIGASGTQAPNGGGAQNGVLASGTFNPAGIVCPAANVGQDMPVLEAMRAGLTYVNVHTNDGVAPTNTGPGDFPGGEIRGQLDHPTH